MRVRLLSAPRIGRFAAASALAILIAGFAGWSPASATAGGEEIDNPAVLELLRGLPAREEIAAPWRSGRYSLFRAGSKEEGPGTARQGSLTGYLYRAPQPGPAPYAVLLAGCGNPHEGANDLWAKLWARYLRDIGAGALVIDGFTGRGVHEVCGKNAKTWADRRVDDAYAALDWLARQPFVDERRVFIIGMSNGARTALLSVSTRETWRYRRFAAAVAFYPVCERLPRHDSMAPNMILMGDSDSEASFPDCVDYVAKRRHMAFAPRLVTYSKAGHLFDVFPHGENYSLFEVIDSRARVLEFLGGLARAPTLADRPATAVTN